ncbi:MAG: hypothetical protein L0Y79_01845 [Chlorobi bacterium]|nr:hypothetical protein [Chlorobiota bacterium]MCI0716189.1 hypothetical protein [Chlorobiota bacterium]
MVFLIFVWGSLTGFLGIFLLFSNLNPPGKYSNFAISYIYHPNVTAFVYTTSIIATIFYLFWKIKELSVFFKLALFLGLLLQFSGLFFTLCRAAVVGVLVGISVYLCVISKRKTLLILPVLLISIPFLISKYIFLKGIASFYSRARLLIPALDLITQSKARFLFGYGISDSIVVFQRNSLLLVKDDINNPHNAILSLLIMFGAIFTIFLIICILFIMIKVFIRGWKSNDYKEKHFFAFLLSSMVALIVHNMFDSQLVMVELFCLQFFLIYLGLSYYLIIFKSRKIPIEPIWK